MAGGFTADFQQNILEWVLNSTSPATTPSTDTFIILFHTTLDDTIAITDTGRVGQGTTDFTVAVGNTTNTWTLPTATSPSNFQNKTTITVSTGDFAAPNETTVKGFIWTDANSTASGNVLAWGNISPTQTLSTGNVIQFSTGQLTISLGGSTSAT